MCDHIGLSVFCHHMWFCRRFRYYQYSVVVLEAICNSFHVQQPPCFGKQIGQNTLWDASNARLLTWYWRCRWCLRHWATLLGLVGVSPPLGGFISSTFLGISWGGCTHLSVCIHPDLELLLPTVHPVPSQTRGFWKLRLPNWHACAQSSALKCGLLLRCHEWNTTSLLVKPSGGGALA